MGLLIHWVNIAVRKSTGAMEASYMDIVRFTKSFILSPTHMGQKAQRKLGHFYFEMGLYFKIVAERNTALAVYSLSAR